MKALILLAALVVSAPAHALDLELTAPTTAGLHIASVHSRGGFCNFNPGAYARWEGGFTIGAYRNSECRASPYGGWTWKTRTLYQLSGALTVGVVLGYKRADVLPLAVPSVAIHLDYRTAVRFAYVPKIEKGEAHTLHLMIERKL
jgi:hypothetical protein